MNSGSRESEIKLERLINQLLNGKPDYISGFYFYLKSSGRTQSLRTQKKYLENVCNFINYVNKDVSEIEMDDVTRYIESSSTKPNGERKGESYRIVLYHSLRKFFKYLYIADKVDKDVTVNIDRPATKPDEEIERTYLTVEEIQQYLYNVKNNITINKHNYRQYIGIKERDYAIIILFLTTGIRLSTLYNLDILERWDENGASFNRAVLLIASIYCLMRKFFLCSIYKILSGFACMLLMEEFRILLLIK